MKQKLPPFKNKNKKVEKKKEKKFEKSGSVIRERKHDRKKNEQ